ncbi:hypothetical protein SLA2020_476470 [Shorea laevis]
MMVRSMATTTSARQPLISRKKSRLSNAERSAYFSRREFSVPFSKNMLVAQPFGSIKPLVYGPSVENKKAIFSLVCQTLKHISKPYVLVNILKSDFNFALHDQESSTWTVPFFCNLPALDLVLSLRDWTICSLVMVQVTFGLPSVGD